MAFLPDKQPVAASPASDMWDRVAEQLAQALAEPESEARVRVLVREWCEEARRREFAPEQLLVVLKSQFVRIPALQGHDERTRRNRLFEHIVSMCIEEYYATAAGSRSGTTSIADDAGAKPDI